MFCKFCGEKIEKDAIFCSKCGAKLTNNEKTHVISTEIVGAQLISSNENKESIKKLSNKTINIIQKIIFNCLIAGIVGISLFIVIVLVGLIAYGRVYLFDGYGFTKVLSIISIVLMMIGLCGIIAKCILYFIFKIGNFPTTIVKKVLIIVLAIACLGCSIWGFENCGDNSNDFNYSSGSTTTSITTRSQAISYAKSNSTVQNKIANLYDLKFYYTPDWGTATAEKQSNGDWEVVIKGTISGYTDDYKTDFVYDKKFTVTVTVYSFGYVGSVYASRY